MVRRALASLLLGWAVAAAAQTAPDCPPTPQVLTPEQVDAGLRNARDRGFLWRLSRDGRISHLFGTIHVAKLDWMFPGPATTAALRASDVIALEIDLLEASQQRRLADANAQNAGAPMPERLNSRIAAIAQRECIAAALIAPLAPEAQVAALVAMSGRRDGLDPTYGIDLFLSGWGRGAKLPVVSLESPESQIAALRTPPGEDRDAAIGLALDEIESGRSLPMLRRIASVWAEADHDALARYDAWCECRRTDAEVQAMKRLLDDRNPGLADAIDRMHRGGQRVFAAIGSLHMVGPLGVHELLARRGYRVERIEPRR